MLLSSSVDGTSSPIDERYVLRADVVVGAMRRKGVKTYVAQAERLGMTRQAWADLRAGKTVAKLPTAFRISNETKLSINNCFERAA